MKLELEVLASTSIKRKKPWKKVAFIGEVHESLFLLDERRISTLYLPSGKTKRKLSKVSNLLPNAITLTFSDNGLFIGGLLASGEVFLWHKETETLRITAPLEAVGKEIQKELQKNSNKYNEKQKKMEVPDLSGVHLSIAGTGQTITLVLNHTELYVWQILPGWQLLRPRDKRPDVPGTWSKVTAEDQGLMEMRQDVTRLHTSAVDSRFFIDQARGTGLNFLYSLVHNDSMKDDMCVTTVALRWIPGSDVLTTTQPTFVSSVKHLSTPLASLAAQYDPEKPSLHAIRSSLGAYVARRSNDGHLLAVAVNQSSTHLNRLVFVGEETENVIVADLVGCGARNPVIKYSKSYWIVEVQWTYDDLFVACMLQQGTLCIVTRLGEPLLMSTHGCSIQMGPKLFLPLHPLIMVKDDLEERPDDPNNLSVALPHPSNPDPMRQRFSVTTHPRFPLIICSDGYMVTVLQLSGGATCLSLMKGLVLESNHYLHKIKDIQKTQLNLFSSIRQENRAAEANKKYQQSQERLGLQAGKSILKESSKYGAPTVGYRFEEPPADLDDGASGDVLNMTLDSDLPQDPLIGMTAGKISFGDVENLNTTLDYRTLAREEGLTVNQYIERCHKCLMLAWSLGASHVGVWMIEHETVSMNIVHNIVRLFGALLHSSQAVTKELTGDADAHRLVTERKTNKKLVKVLRLYARFLQLLRFDHITKHMQVVALKFAHSTAQMLVTNRDLALCESRRATFHGAFVMLKYTELELANIYMTDLPRSFSADDLLNGTAMFGDGALEACATYSLVRGKPAIEEGIHNLTGDTDQLEGNARSRANTQEENGLEQNERSVDEPNQSETSFIEVRNRMRKTTVESIEPQPFKKLCASWCYLYKQLSFYFKNSIAAIKGLRGQERASKRVESWKILELAVAIQCKLHSMGIPIPVHARHKLPIGERLSVDGSGLAAIQAWVQNLDLMPDADVGADRGCRALLSLLYTWLRQYELRAALELVEALIRCHGDVRQGAAVGQHDARSRRNILTSMLEFPDNDSSPINQNAPPRSMPPRRYVCNRAVRCVVLSMARFMAAYFTPHGRALFVYPAHCPRKLPPLHVQDYNISAHRIVPLYRQRVSADIRMEGLDNTWTVERCMEYLMLCGAATDAAWLAHCLGDWKTTVLLGVAINKHKQGIPQLYQRKKLCLPPELEPHQIIQGKLQEVVIPPDATAETFEQLHSHLSDLLLASVLGRLSVLPLLVESLTLRLLDVAGRFPVNVADDFYLPAPPVYCPQPTQQGQTESNTEGYNEERMLRQELSGVVQLLQVALRASHTTLPAARCYSQHVIKAFSKGLKYWRNLDGPSVDVDVVVLQEVYLSVTSLLTGQEERSAVRAVLVAFRELCTVCWMMYARDKLAMALRDRQKLRKHGFTEHGDEWGDAARHSEHQPQEEGEEDWSTVCERALEWTQHMLPFSYFLPDGEKQLPGLLISLVMELPPTIESAHYLAEHLHDVDTLHPDTQDRLENLLRQWRGVFLTSEQRPPGASDNSPRGFTLSLYYEKMAHKMTKTLRRKNRTFKKFSQYVWSEPLKGEEGTKVGQVQKENIGEELFIGSRPMESSEAYLKFLDVFFAVCFTKRVEEEKENGVDPLKPLLQDFGAEIVDKELRSLVHQSIISFQKKDSTNKLNFNHSPSFPPSPRSPKSLRPSLQDRIKSTPPMSPQRRVGLFRSRSISDMRSSASRKDRASSSSLHREQRQSQQQQGNKMDLSLVNEGDDDDGKPPSPGRKPRSRSTSRTRNRSTSGDRPMLLEDLKTNESPKRQRRYNSESEAAASSRPGSLRRARSEDHVAIAGPDPLDVPILQAWILELMDFGKPYEQLETLLEWLARWAGRNHNIGGATGGAGGNRKASITGTDAPTTTTSQPTMRIRVPPRVIIYSLWQREQNYADALAPGQSYQQEEMFAPEEVVDDNGVEADTQTDITITGIEDEYDIISITGLNSDMEEEEAPVKKSKKDKKKKKKRRKESVRMEEEQINGTIEPDLQAAILEAVDPLNEAIGDREQQEIDAIEAEEAMETEALVPNGVIHKGDKSDDLTRLIEQEMRTSMRDTLDKLRRSLEDKQKAIARDNGKSSMEGRGMRMEGLLTEDTPDGRRHDYAPSIQPSEASFNTATQPFTDRDPLILDEDGHAEAAVAKSSFLSSRHSRSSGGGLDTSTPRKGRRKSSKTSLSSQRLIEDGEERGGGGGGQIGGNIADDLRNIIRTELRKIMQAQHQGIEAALGALGNSPSREDEITPLVSVSQTAAKRNRGSRKKTGAKNVDCLVMQATSSSQQQQQQHQQHHHHHQDSSFTHVSSYTERSSTDEVTPLPSDADDLEKTGSSHQKSRPLSISQLNTKPSSSSSGLRSKGQVWDLDLESVSKQQRQSDSHHHHHHQQQQQQPQSYSNQQTYQQDRNLANKENQQTGPILQFPDMPPLLFDPTSTNDDHHEPFRPLLNILNEMNRGGGMQQQQQQHPDRDISQPGYFAAPDQQQRMPQQQQAGTPHYQNDPQLFGGGSAQSHHHQFQVPERDVNAPLQPPPSYPATSSLPRLNFQQQTHGYTQANAHIGGMIGGFPLLSIDNESLGHPFGVPGAESELPILIPPPEELIAHEQNKYQKNPTTAEEVRRGLMAKYVQEMEAARRDVLGVRLIQEGFFEPFQEKDERGSVIREKHRNKKKEKEKKKKRRQKKGKEEESESIVTETSQDEEIEIPTFLQPKKSSPRKQEMSQEEQDRYAGYALTPGLFDEYVAKGTASSNEAWAQQRAATAMKSTQSSPRKLQEKQTSPMATMSTTEAANEVVRQAIEKHYRQHGQEPGAVLAPDIYLGLRFPGSSNEQSQTQLTDNTSGSGRAFLNVVDLNGDLLDQISNSVPERDPSSHTSLNRARSSPVLGSPIRQRSPSRESVRRSPRRSPSPRGDRVTEQMFAQMQESEYRRDVVQQAIRIPSKDNMSKRLQYMDDQFQVIDALANNIQDDFDATKKYLEHMDQINQVMMADGQQESSQTPRPDMHDQDTQMTSRSSPRKASSPSPRSPKRATPRTPRTPRSPHKEMEMSQEDEMMGEYLRSGEIRAEDVGLTDTEAQQLMADSLRRSEERSPGRSFGGPSPGSTHDLSRSLEEKREHEREEKEKRTQMVREWMAKRSKQQNKEYKERINSLREKEHSPFAAKHDLMRTPSSAKELEEMKKGRMEKKKQKEEEAIEMRKHEAAELIQDLLETKPDLPKEIPRDHTIPRHTTSKTPRSTARSTRKDSARGGKTTMRKQTPSPATRRAMDDSNRMEVSLNPYLQNEDDNGYGVPEWHSKTRNFSPPHHSPHMVRPHTTEGRMDGDRQRQGDTRRPVSAREHPLSPQTTYQDRLALVTPGKPFKAISKTALQRLYGTKRVPGRTASTYHIGGQQRPVKTWAQRQEERQLSEVEKTPPHFHSPRMNTARSTAGGRVTDRSVERRGIPPPHHPRHKPLTYTQQLQQLQPNQTHHDVKHTRTTQALSSRPAMIRRPVGPQHKTKTYTQQLQELQKPATTRQMGPPQMAPQAKVYKSHPMRRSLDRSRPYGDPYAAPQYNASMEDEYDDNASVTTSWHLDENVKKILYGDDASSYRPTSAAATEHDISGVDDDFPVGAEAGLSGSRDEVYTYTNLVGIDDLEAASSTSALSFIDWDQMDKLAS